MTYELFYDTGGHGGPYGLSDAFERSKAMLRGCNSMSSVRIVERSDGIGGFGKTVTTIRKTDIMTTE
jgi:hypothetical protein